VALVAAQREGEASVSARVRRGVDLDAARLMQRAAARLGPAWGGGGHAGAAGLSGKGDAAKGLQACMQALREGP
jgi:nanoRNase/pAp phosphatase (c-di-AMP/oligoRNAs hydrolase)